MRFFSRRATSSRARPSSRGRRRLLASCDKNSKEGLGKPRSIHVRLAGCGLPLLRLYHARWQGSWVLTGRAVTRFRFSRALAGITRAGRDRFLQPGSHPPVPRGSRALGGIACASWTRILSIIPYSVRAESMTSLFTFELRLTTLSRAGSENHFILEGAADGVALVPRGQGASEWQLSKWQRVAYAPGVPNCTPGTD